jgi:predicted acylesterase/phospholipase RssA
MQFWTDISKHIPFLSKSDTTNQESIGTILHNIHNETPEIDDTTTTTDEPLIDAGTDVEVLPIQRPCPTTIKHIVIAGGGDYGFSFYSALRDSHRAGFWNINNIETIYGTSIGALFAVFTSLLPKVGFDVYDDFIMNRPWHKVFDFHINKLLQMIKEKGIFGKTIVEETIAPVLLSLDIPLDVNMKDFYETTNIEIHLIATNLTAFEIADISYKTHPEWKLIDALYSSMGLPVLFVPNIIDGNIYSDGAFINNYPVNLCIQNGAHPDEILGMVRVSMSEETNTVDVQPVVLNTLFDYIFFIFGSLLSRVSTPPMKVKNQIEFMVNEAFVNIYNIYRATSQKDRRTELFTIGTNTWTSFYEKTYPSTEPQTTDVES